MALSKSALSDLLDALHAGIGYVTPDDEHSGRGAQLRKARRQGLEWARRRRIAYHPKHGKEQRP
jgi:putative transposase